MKVLIHEKILLVLGCIAIVYYIIVQWNYPSLQKYIDTHTPKIHTVDDILPTIENGDIILFSGDTRGEKTCKYFTNTFFSHIGFLFREKHPETGENVIYVWESDLGQNTKDGVRILPLKNKLQLYGGCKIAAIKKLLVYPLVERPSTQKIVGLIGDYIDLEFDHKILSWWTANFPVLYRLIKDDTTIFCSELIAAIYQKLGILRKDKVSAWYSPGDFHRSTLDFEKGYGLGNTTFFSFNE